MKNLKTLLLLLPMLLIAIMGFAQEPEFLNKTHESCVNSLADVYITHNSDSLVEFVYQKGLVQLRFEENICVFEAVRSNTDNYDIIISVIENDPSYHKIFENVWQFMNGEDIEYKIAVMNREHQSFIFYTAVD